MTIKKYCNAPCANMECENKFINAIQEDADKIADWLTEGAVKTFPVPTADMSDGCHGYIQQYDEDGFPTTLPMELVDD